VIYKMMMYFSYMIAPNLTSEGETIITLIFSQATFRKLSKDIISGNKNNTSRISHGYFTLPQKGLEKHYTSGFSYTIVTFIH